MEIDIEYENWRQAGDPLQKPEGWTLDSPHAGDTTTNVDTGSTPTPSPIDEDTTPSVDDYLPSEEEITTSQAEQEADIATSLEKQREAIRQQADYLFNPRIQRARQIGEQQVGTAEGASGQRAGFNLSTAESQFIQSVENKVEDRIGEIEREKEAYIASGDFAAVQRADEKLEKLKDRKTDMLLARANLAVQLMGVEQSQEQINLQTIDALNKIPAGQTVEVNGKMYTGIAVESIDPFFKGSDIVSIAKSLPVGESTTIIDPNTGEEIEIMGLDFNPDMGTNTIQSTDNAGNVTLTTYDQLGNIVNQVSAGSVGKISPIGGGSGDTSMLTQSVLNKLAANGITEDWAKSIQSVLATMSKESAVATLTDALINQRYGDTKITLTADTTKNFMAQAENMIQKYQNVMAGSDFFDKIGAVVDQSLDEALGENG